MNDQEILNYFDAQAKSGQWGSLYDINNPESYTFITRFNKGINLINSIENKTVLDLGCGTGVLIPHIVNNKGIYIGLDSSQNMLDEVKKQYADWVASGKIQLVAQDIRDFNTTSKIDVLIGLGFIEYFDNPQTIIKKLYDFLPVGGQLVLSFPNFNSLDYFVVKLFSPMRYLLRIISGKSTLQPPRRLWNRKSSEKMFLNAGFKNLKLVRYNINIFAYPFTRISRRFTNFWAKRLEYSSLSKVDFFSVGFIISGEK